MNELLPTPDQTSTTPPLGEGETFSRTVCYSAEDIARFARDTGDFNPVHHDSLAARRARHGDIIASGQQTAGQMMGLVATHFSRNDDGVEREMLCLNFNFSFQSPVFAEQPLTLTWRVTQLSANAKLRGWVGELAGEARREDGRVCVLGRGTVLVKTAEAWPDTV